MIYYRFKKEPGEEDQHYIEMFKRCYMEDRFKVKLEDVWWLADSEDGGREMITGRPEGEEKTVWTMSNVDTFYFLASVIGVMAKDGHFYATEDEVTMKLC